MITTISILLLLSCCITAFRPRFLSYKAPVESGYHYTTRYIQQKVDHFGFSNHDSYKMRYIYADQYWNRENGPIFFYTGNEGDIVSFANNTGFMWDIAPEYKALLIFAEHRYYGKSLPYGKDSFKTPEHTRYFTSEQALADFAILVKALTGGRNSNPVILFGGSYGGMLAAWFRMKYPHLVAGAIAASAPIWQFQNLTDCNAYNRIVTVDFTNTNMACAMNIHKSWDILNKFGATSGGRQLMTQTFKLCKTLASTDDLATMKQWLADTLGNIAMVNYPYPASFIQPLPAWPVKEFCKPLSGPNYNDEGLMLALAKSLGVYFNYTGNTKCLDIYSEYSSGLDDNAWDYQTCTEMVMPMCSDGQQDMFELQKWDFDAYRADCYKRWQVRADAGWIVTHYGDRNITAASNILFSNGDLDPWSGGGVLRTLTSSLPAIRIPYSAHHLDLRAHNPADTVYVKYARRQERAYISKWIKQARSKG